MTNTCQALSQQILDKKEDRVVGFFLPNLARQLSLPVFQDTSIPNLSNSWWPPPDFKMKMKSNIFLDAESKRLNIAVCCCYVFRHW